MPTKHEALRAVRRDGAATLGVGTGFATNGRTCGARWPPGKGGPGRGQEEGTAEDLEGRALKLMSAEGIEPRLQQPEVPEHGRWARGAPVRTGGGWVFVCGGVGVDRALWPDHPPLSPQKGSIDGPPKILPRLIPGPRR